MAYVFSNQKTGKVKVTDENSNDFTLSGINTKETDANVMMAGLSYMLDIVGWKVTDAVRIVNQDVIEE